MNFNTLSLPKICSLFLFVVSPAGLTEVIPDSVIATFNSDATLECTTEAGPNTKILWLFRASKDLCVTSTNCNPGDFNITEGMTDIPTGSN